MGDGHEALRCSRYSMDWVPPDGHGLVLVSQRLSGAGAEQAAAQPLMVLRVAPVLLHDDQPPNVAGGRLVVPAGQL